MVDATLGFALDRLSNLLSDEVSTRRGVKNGLRWLEEELGYLQSSVRDAESKQERDHLTSQWIDNVRDVANEVVLILDCVSVLEEDHAGSRKGVLDCVQSLCKKEVNLYRIGKKMKTLKERIVEIKNRRHEYGITNHSTTLMVKQRKRTLLRATSFENHVDVVGFEDDVKTLLAEILRDEPSLSVISIHGMGGLGKTTLAGKLYHSRELNHFQGRAWVCVSQEYNIKDVLKRIIKSFERHELDLFNLDEIDLLQHLRKLLEDRDRYLAVIDDVWDIRAWEKIKQAFPDKKNGSRVIITTRNKKVAERVDDRCFVHELRFLREDESWQLFCKRANPTRNLENLGKEMVSRCGGLPLAIVVLSGLLLHKKSYDDWSKVKDHIWRQLKGDSVEIQEILSLSYDDLPFKMRQCFLYIARFPEDQNFRVNDLMQFWIAEEFILEVEEGDRVVMEDVAEDYLNELINRNMNQIAVLQLNGQVRECRVHDLVRDLAIQKANEDKLLVTLDLCKENPRPTCLLRGQLRHVIYNGISKYLDLLEPSSDYLKLRSLTLSNKIGTPELEEIQLIYTRFKYLKVLDLTNACSPKISKVIGNLYLLKFLGLMGHVDSMTPLVIPSTICKLKKLQTLRGSRSSHYIVPRVICELKELRHLMLRFFNFRRAIGFFHIKSHQKKLQTLATIRYEDWSAIDTVNLTGLSALVISNQSPREHVYNLDSLANITSLHTLSIQCSAIPTIEPLSFCKRLKKVFLVGTMKDPSDLSLLPNSVTQLTLVRSELIQDPMPALESLSNLIGLDLSRIYMGKKMVCSQDAFPSLQYLNVRDLPCLEEWEVEDETLPSLKGFNMDSCQNLKMIPQRFKGVPPIPDIFRVVTDTDMSFIYVY